LSHSVLLQNKLPVADFALVSLDQENEIKKVFEDFEGSIVIKPRFGGWGIGVEKIDSEERLEKFIKMTTHSENKTKQLLIEKYFKNDLSKWVAAVVFGEKVIFGYKKKIMSGSGWKIYDPEKKDGRGNYSDFVELSQELKDYALKAKSAIGKDIIGFDFIYTEEGYKIIDENGRPGLYADCIKKSGIDIEDEIVNLILNKVKLKNK
jgi:glutathione synthase/RimK-type ligase-like ATP-grasp enzyme